MTLASYVGKIDEAWKTQKQSQILPSQASYL